MEKLPEIEIIGNTELIPLDEKISYAGIGFIFDDEIEVCTNLFNFLAQATLNDCDFGFIDINISETDLLTLKSGIVQSDIHIYVFLPNRKNTIEATNLAEIGKIISELSSGKSIVFILNKNSMVLSGLNPDLYYILPDTSIPALISCIVSISGRNLENS